MSANHLDPHSEPFIGPQPRVDLLANYCHHSEKMLMTVDWSHGISHVGQCFEGGLAAFRLVLSKYAIECGFDFKFVKNDSVQRLNNLHSCGAVVRTGKNNRLNSKLVCNVIGDRLRDKPLTHPTDVVFELKKEYDLNVSYHVAWLGVEKARGEMYGDYHASFDQLRWYADAGDLKTICLQRRGKDGNKGLFRLAFTIVDSETTANWTWFLQQLTKVVSSARTLTFVSNRNIGLLEPLPAVFPSAHQAYCLQHLQANLRDKLRWVDNRVRFGLIAKLRECAYAPTEASFQQH
ncbi:uncharacterized protein LOC114309675 [Camellia sinensis]|uniref:uncharacterized protein LOC114309675 n=1 Tax=Camellia sinensis TaxID=4442 RepID=UPI0010363176|nr:uncharacterized protein LOC114309675 [Camellia sinensis]